MWLLFDAVVARLWYCSGMIWAVTLVLETVTVTNSFAVQVVVGGAARYRTHARKSRQTNLIPTSGFILIRGLGFAGLTVLRTVTTQKPGRRRSTTKEIGSLFMRAEDYSLRGCWCNVLAG